jgi:hypothetical protein
MNKKWYTKAEAQVLLNCSEKELNKFSVKGYLKPFRLGKSLIRFNIKNLQYFQNHQKERERDDKKVHGQWYDLL